MPDWTAPFHMPKFTDEGFEIQRAKKVARDGYKIEFPGLEDVFHFGMPKPLTASEEVAWKGKDPELYFGTERYDEIKAMKQKKRERYQQMLSSPTPDIVRNAGSVLTAIDDAQDCISTIGMIGRIAVKLAPRFLARSFLGPIGWLLLANDILNLIITLGQMGTMPLMGGPMASKRGAQRATFQNPFSKKSGVARARKVRSWKPTPGDVIQALQTSDQIFGFGICLGPLVGCAQDIVSGAIRGALGQPVDVKWPWEPPPKHIEKAFKTIKSAPAVLAAPDMMDDDLLDDFVLSNYLAQIAVQPYVEEWNPLDNVDLPPDVKTLCPIPADPLTLEVIAEEGVPLSKVVGWPHISKPWADVGEMFTHAAPLVSQNLKASIKRDEYNWKGYARGVLACEAASYQMANLEGEAEVRYDYNIKSKIMSRMLEDGFYVDPDNKADRIERFTDFLDVSEERNITTAPAQAVYFCKNNGIDLKEIKLA